MNQENSKKLLRLENRAQWDSYFQSDWEENNGREQTRLFAEAFARYTCADRLECRSVLDSSCALGDALPVLKRVFPNATLTGIDFSEQAIERCKREYSDIGNFFVKTIEEIEGHFDIIYSSATLEHFEDYKQKARILLKHCNKLCILVPYNEKRFGSDLTYSEEYDHVVTFREDSFDYLVAEGIADAVTNVSIFSVTGAWSWAAKTHVIQFFKNFLRLIMGRPLAKNKKMMLFEITSHALFSNGESAQ